MIKLVINSVFISIKPILTNVTLKSPTRYANFEMISNCSRPALGQIEGFMKQKALTSSAHIVDNELANYALNIVSNMTANPFYAEPKPTLSAIQALITLYSAALLKTLDGNKADTANKNACRVHLVDALSLLANYVNLTSANDLVQIQTSGFNISQVHTPVGILDAPILQMSFGNNPGEVNYNINSDPQASDYTILFSTVPAPVNDAEWRSKLVSSTKGIITGLNHKTDYVFKACANSSEANKRNVYNYSKPVEQYVT